jgi:hypothetical protein
MILMIGAEFVAFGAIQEAKHKDESVGPHPEDSVPQHEVLREERPVSQQSQQAREQPTRVG